MKKAIKQIIKNIFPLLTLHYKAYSVLIKNDNSYLYSTGWIQSLNKGKPINRNEDPVPWMNYPIISLLEDRLKDDINLFEYGSGYSTNFYAAKVKSVTSVEYDQAWFDIIKPNVPENVEIIFQKNDTDAYYCETISSTGRRYDVVIIDGRDRVNCLKKSISCLSPKGVIIFDDSHRDRYQEGFTYAKENGFKNLNIEGLKATGAEVERSTIFYREDNCLDI